MSQPDVDAPPPLEEGGLNHLGEDTVGFGRLELRTARDALLKPAEMLAGYMAHGPTAGRRYSRPLRFYLTLCGLLMLQLFLMGGTALWLGALPPETLDPFVQRSGKSADAFMADADNWMSLVLVPINAAFYALFSAPLLRWWDPEDLGWRRAFRATFHYLNVWTLPIVPIGFLAYMPATAPWVTALMVAASFWAFLRAGRGRWYRSRLGGLVKAAVITAASFLASLIATVPVVLIGMAGGVLA